MRPVCSQVASNTLDDVYHAITEPGSFRLLILKPGQREDHLSIELRYAKLADEPLNYEALSYSCHEELAPLVESPSIVICRGIELTVQPNLGCFKATT
jgi:hypothetical protein